MTWNRSAFLRNFYLATENEILTELNGFAVKSLISSFFVAMMLDATLVAYLVPNHLGTMILVTGYALASKALFDFTVERERIRERFNSCAIRCISRPLIFLVLLWLFFTGSPESILLIWASSLLLPSLGPIANLVRESTFTGTNYLQLAMVKQWFPLSVGMLFDAATNNIGRIILFHVAGTDVTGVFSKPFDICRQGLATLFGVYGGLQVQKVQKLEAAGQLTDVLLKKRTQHNLWVLLSITIASLLMGPVCFHFLLPSILEHMKLTTLAILIGACCLNSFRIYFIDNLLLLFDSQRIVAVKAIVTTLVTAALTYPLVMRSPVTGAVLALSLSLAISTAFSLLYLFRRIKADASNLSAVGSP